VDHLREVPAEHRRPRAVVGSCGDQRRLLISVEEQHTAEIAGGTVKPCLDLNHRDGQATTPSPVVEPGQRRRGE